MKFIILVTQLIIEVSKKINDKLVKISDEPLPSGSPLPPVCRVLTFSGTFRLDGLSEGGHTLRLYYGYQYTSADVKYTDDKVRYEIWGVTDVHFSVNSAPATSTPMPPSPAQTSIPTQLQLAQEDAAVPGFLEAIGVAAVVVVLAAAALSGLGLKGFFLLFIQQQNFLQGWFCFGW